ncbi:hypothetical protein B484DRAFT_449151 [Ochromonadaceae sp. CCMP2298]|nr:hypothetical protein B484DRAFT_449151 [Ochromonadaceae sp. CCMP2298]
MSHSLWDDSGDEELFPKSEEISPSPTKPRRPDLFDSDPEAELESESEPEAGDLKGADFEILYRIERTMRQELQAEVLALRSHLALLSPGVRWVDERAPSEGLELEGLGFLGIGTSEFGGAEVGGPQDSREQMASEKRRASRRVVRGRQAASLRLSSVRGRGVGAGTGVVGDARTTNSIPTLTPAADPADPAASASVEHGDEEGALGEAEVGELGEQSAEAEVGEEGGADVAEAEGAEAEGAEAAELSALRSGAADRRRHAHTTARARQAQKLAVSAGKGGLADSEQTQATQGTQGRDRRSVRRLQVHKLSGAGSGAARTLAGQGAGVDPGGVAVQETGAPDGLGAMPVPVPASAPAPALVPTSESVPASSNTAGLGAVSLFESGSESGTGSGSEEMEGWSSDGAEAEEAQSSVQPPPSQPQPQPQSQPQPQPQAQAQAQAQRGTTGPQGGQLQEGQGQWQEEGEIEGELDRRLRSWAGGRDLLQLLASLFSPGVLSATALDALQQKGVGPALLGELPQGVRKVYLRVVSACHPDKLLHLPQGPTRTELCRLFVVLCDKYANYRSSC